jgi:hypothetical protein
MKRRLCVLALAAVAAAALAAAPALSAALTPFQTGRYVGQTSQGFTIVFSLRYIKTCGGRQKRTLCLIQTGRVKISATCSDGKTNTNPHLDIVRIAVGNSGVVSGSSGIELIPRHIKVRRNGTLAGSMFLRRPRSTTETSPAAAARSGSQPSASSSRVWARGSRLARTG